MLQIGKEHPSKVKICLWMFWPSLREYIVLKVFWKFGGDCDNYLHVFLIYCNTFFLAKTISLHVKKPSSCKTVCFNQKLLYIFTFPSQIYIDFISHDRFLCNRNWGNSNMLASKKYVEVCGILKCQTLKTLVLDICQII